MYINKSVFCLLDTTVTIVFFRGYKMRKMGGCHRVENITSVYLF